MGMSMGAGRDEGVAKYDARCGREENTSDER
jgi:hypothetical protein